jgi:hypothetical protein
MIDGLVYYALDATRHAQYLKIGYTTGLKARMIALREITASGQQPIVLALEEGSLTLERERHGQFADLRSHGEWFRYTDALPEFVGSLEHPYSYLLDRPSLWPYAGGWGPLSTLAGGQKPPGATRIEPEPEPMSSDQVTPIDF